MGCMFPRGGAVGGQHSGLWLWPTANQRLIICYMRLPSDCPNQKALSLFPTWVLHPMSGNSPLLATAPGLHPNYCRAPSGHVLPQHASVLGCSI